VGNVYYITTGGEDYYFKVLASTLVGVDTGIIVKWLSPTEIPEATYTEVTRLINDKLEIYDIDSLHFKNIR